MHNLMDNIDKLSQLLDIRWNNRDILVQALTHSSFSYENRARGVNNERLEFLGDAVLELVISEYLYLNFPEYSEGELTKLRAAVVCEPSLTRVAVELNLGRCLLMGRGEERSGGRQRPSILSDAFEALLGAVYIDQGPAKTREIVLKYIKPLVQDVLKGRLDRDYKTELQELLQKRSSEPVGYVILKEEGPDHEKIFTAGVIYMGRELGRGSGHSKKEAEQQAAKHAMDALAEN